MQHHRALTRLHQAAVLCFALLLAGLFVLNTHPALFQLGLAGFTLAAVGAGLQSRHPGSPRMRPALLGFGGLFLLHVLSGVFTAPGNWPAYWQDLRLHLPLLLLPLGFWLLPPWPATWMRQLWVLFVGLVGLSALGSTVYYLLHQDALHLAYSRSQIMPTRPDYVRFSLMVSLATAYCAVRAWQLGGRSGPPTFSSRRTTLKGAPAGGSQHEASFGDSSPTTGKSRQTTVMWLLAGGGLLLFQHLLAVRSGLLATYALGLLAVAWLVWRPKAYRPAAGLLAVLLLLPLLSYRLLPTFRLRFHNTIYDVARRADVQSANNYSLVGRVYSWKVARTVVATHPWLGVGPANLPDALAAAYRREYPAIEPSAYLKPHNQGLYWLVSFGLLGTLAAGAAFYYPMLRHWRRPPPLLLAQYVILSLSFLVEPTLETPVGLAFAAVLGMLSTGTSRNEQ